MFDLERKVAEWRQDAARVLGGQGAELDELEGHLRDRIDQLANGGASEERAFSEAVASLGVTDDLAREYAKLDGRTGWFPVRLAWAVVGLAAIALMVFVPQLARINEPVLIGHMFGLMSGYLVVFLTGILSACYACARLLSGLGQAQGRSLARATVRLCSLSAGLIVVATVLGALWSKASWGRYWSWDVRETGSLLVMLWAVLVGVVQWRTGEANRLVAGLALVGSLLLVGVWFAGQAASSHPQPYGLAFHPLWIGLVTVHVMMLGLCLVPAGRLRRIQ